MNATTVMVSQAKELPLAIALVMFKNIKILYKGKQITTKIVHTKKGRALRVSEIGNFIYIQQDKFGHPSKWSVLAQEGHKILWIVHKTTGKIVGKVIDGKVTKI